METQTIIPKCKNLLTAMLLLASLHGFSQTATDKTQVTTLQNYVDGIKEKNPSIKNVDSVNVMVNDKLVTDLQTVIIDPKRIALLEVLVLEPKPGSTKINPSIIINTK